MRTGSARSTPARGTAVTEPKSGGASSNKPKRASKRSAQRSPGSVSWLAMEASLLAPPKADRFESAPCVQANGAEGATGMEPDRLGLAGGTASKGNGFGTGEAAFQPKRRRRLRMA